MERQFQINWAALVEEAKQRRKAQKLTQQRLAELAKVSTPTISRFENGEKDIQLSTILKIFAVLGMADERRLIFSDSSAHHDFDRGIVVFKGEDGNKTIKCAISDEALADHFDGDHKDPLKVFVSNRDRIEHEVRRKYLAGAIEADGSVLVKTSDL